MFIRLGKDIINTDKIVVIYPTDTREEYEKDFMIKLSSGYKIPITRMELDKLLRFVKIEELIETPCYDNSKDKQ